MGEQRPARLEHIFLGGPSDPTLHPSHREGTRNPPQVILTDSKALVAG